MLKAPNCTGTAGARTAALLLLCLSLGLPTAQAQTTSSSAPVQTARTPQQAIGRLGLDIRKILEDPQASASPEDAERAVADQIRALIARSPGHLSLTATDSQGRTPLMQAASGGYAQVVQALLSDQAVRLTINQPDARGETAWMLANFAPSLTLTACQPAALTVDRYALLPPYLRRMAHLLKQQPSPISVLIRDLEAAGAEPDPEAAKRAWLARCHNAAPETRAALAQSDLLSTTLVTDALARQREFNEAAKDSFRRLPQTPPAEMKFVQDRGDRPRGREAPLLRISEIRCEFMARPELPNLIKWSGSLKLRAVASVRAGVVETADFTVLAGSTKDKRVVEAFSALIVRALAKYRCEGDPVFEQEFEFRVQ